MNGLGRNEQKNKDSQSVFTKETLGVILVLFSTLVLVCLISRDAIFFNIGKYINSFMFGLFGYFAYAVCIWTMAMGICLIMGKRLPLSSRMKTHVTIFFILLVCLIQAITVPLSDKTFSQYIVDTYNMATNGIVGSSAGGLVCAMAVYLLLQLSSAGCYVLLAVLSVGNVYLCVKDYEAKPRQPKTKKEKFNSSFVETNQQELGVEIVGEKEYPVLDAVLTDKQETPAQKLFVPNASDFSFKTKREMSKDDTTIKLNKGNGGLSLGMLSNSLSNGSIAPDELKKKIEYIKTPAEIDLSQNKYGQASASRINVSSVIPKQPIEAQPEKEELNLQQPKEREVIDIPFYEHDESSKVVDDAKTHAEDFSNKYLGVAEEEFGFNALEEENLANEEREDVFRPLPTYEEHLDKEEPVKEDALFNEDLPKANLFESDKEEQDEPPVSNVPRMRARLGFGDFTETPKEKEPEKDDSFMPRGRDRSNDLFSPKPRDINFMEQENPKKEEKPAFPVHYEYKRPPIDLLEDYSVNAQVVPENHQERKEIIKQTLADFHINVEPQNHIQGPTITRYEVMMPAGIPVKKVLNYSEDLRMRLASKDGIRIEAPIPGKNLVGVEVANKTKITVGLREIIENSSAKPNKPGSLNFAIGKDIVGNAITDNLAKGPHYLVAGATGSGKSVSLDVMIVSLIMRYSPEELRFILIDPKRVGFRKYEHLPHLMIDEIVVEPQRAVAVLLWACEEMEKRYDMFQANPGVSDIDSYNQLVAGDTVPKMPRIVVIVDELADLMETNKKEMDSRIRRLSAKARAAGIHLVLATQRPSVDVVTGTIKANLPSRIALKVMTPADSITILSEGGAEKLLGTGDMLYKNSGMSECERYQGAWISDREILNIVSYIKTNNKSYYDDELSTFLDNSTKPVQEESFVDGDNEGEESEVNEFFLKALWLAVNTKTVSISQLQRRFQIGYARAGGLVDKMERMGFISGNEGSKARKVLLTREEFEDKFGPMSDAY